MNAANKAVIILPEEIYYFIFEYARKYLQNETPDDILHGMGSVMCDVSITHSFPVPDHESEFKKNFHEWLENKYGCPECGNLNFNKKGQNEVAQ